MDEEGGAVVQEMSAYEASFRAGLIGKRRGRAVLLKGSILAMKT